MTPKKKVLENQFLKHQYKGAGTFGENAQHQYTDTLIWTTRGGGRDEDPADLICFASTACGLGEMTPKKKVLENQFLKHQYKGAGTFGENAQHQYTDTLIWTTRGGGRDEDPADLIIKN